MTRRITLYCFLSAAFYGGLLCFLSAYSGHIAGAVFQTTELPPCVERPYDPLPINAFSIEALLDHAYFVTVLGRANGPLETDFHAVAIDNAPGPTFALFFPLAMLLLLARSRWLIEKIYNYMAFPVF